MLTPHRKAPAGNRVWNLLLLRQCSPMLNRYFHSLSEKAFHVAWLIYSYPFHFSCYFPLFTFAISQLLLLFLFPASFCYFPIALIININWSVDANIWSWSCNLLFVRQYRTIPDTMKLYILICDCSSLHVLLSFRGTRSLIKVIKWAVLQQFSIALALHL